VRNALGRDPMDGSLYVYVNRKATQMRVLYFDRSGYCVWGKRLEAGKECCM
jgi:transposase